MALKRDYTHKTCHRNNWSIKNLRTKIPKNEPLEEESPEELSPEKDQVSENNEISIQYVHVWEIYDRNNIVVDNIFSYKVALDISRTNDDEYEP